MYGVKLREFFRASYGIRQYVNNCRHTVQLKHIFLVKAGLTQVFKISAKFNCKLEYFGMIGAPLSRNLPNVFT